jgi:hypothetical protein
MPQYDFRKEQKCKLIAEGNAGAVDLLAPLFFYITILLIGDPGGKIGP